VPSSSRWLVNGMTRKSATALLLLSLLLLAGSARADGGAWLWFEYRLPLTATDRLPRVSVRFWSDTRLSGGAGGLAQQFVRIGPIFEVTPWFFLAMHGTIYADRLADGRFDQEARFELEPNFQGRLWRFTWSDRNRLEYRWRESVQRVRYRNQLRINYAPPGARWIPYVWNEALFDVAAGFNENRLTAGIGRMLRPNIRLEAGYLLRSRDLPGQGWSHDHIGTLYLFIGLPPVPSPAGS
jgi:hypothetical protein